MARISAWAVGLAARFLQHAQEQLAVGDPLEHRRERTLVEPSGSTELAPDPVGPVVQLDGREQPLVLDVLLGDAPGTGGVVVGPVVGQPLADLVLQRVVDERDEPQLAAPDALLPPLVDQPQQVADMRPDAPLGVPCAWFAPCEPAQDDGVLSDAPLEVVLRLKARDQLGCRGDRLHPAALT